MGFWSFVGQTMFFFAGFCIDILEKLAETIGFTYTLYMVPDGKFGTKDPDTYQWNGMVKELVFRVKLNYC